MGEAGYGTALEVPPYAPPPIQHPHLALADAGCGDLLRVRPSQLLLAWETFWPAHYASEMERREIIQIILEARQKEQRNRNQPATQQ